MVVKSLKRFTSGRTPIVLLLVLLFISLYLMSSATQNSQLFDENYSTLLLVNLTALVLLVTLIGRHLTRLIIQYRRREPDSRFTARLVVIFSVLAVTPILELYYFSMQFLHRGIDNWFEMHVDQVLEDALELGRSSIDSRVKELVRQSRNIANEIGDQHDASVTIVLSRLRQQSGASELTLLTSSGDVIASSSSDATNIVPALPSQAILQQLQAAAEKPAAGPGKRGSTHGHRRAGGPPNPGLRALRRLHGARGAGG